MVTGLRIIVCGGRDYDDRARLYAALDVLHARRPIATLVQGGARGADRLAADWAHDRGVTREEHPADWKSYAKWAGRMRNLHMARLGADLLVAFPGGRGTAHMIETAARHKIKVWRPYS